MVLQEANKCIPTNIKCLHLQKSYIFLQYAVYSSRKLKMSSTSTFKLQWIAVFTASTTSDENSFIL